ncbi:HAD family phosphatase [Phormidium sp. FACHB-1136]|uniref:HAD family hydrolase n=1 Tax=Phormidium sp. FACHB-1136 TaxID=2692848 RepID=UPI001688D9DA|nr:HAD family phosphatase [Phormidium sp. FACHB-1136]MBD2427905.1 HAD family phosphatase [Phormidium sp. FACHB-1136]
MVLRAVLLDFNGVIINDEPLHQTLIQDLLLEENLRPSLEDYQQVCLGRTDRACITDLWQRQGRVVTEAQLNKFLDRKAARYRDALAALDSIPLYPGLEDVVYQIRAAHLKLAIVSGARRSEIDAVLALAGMADYVHTIVSGDDLAVAASKPAPDGYLLAIARLNQQFPDLGLTAANCLAVEDSFAGIESARRAGVPVVGVAHAFPYHMIHRRANWAVDHLYELSLEWLQPYYADRPTPAATPSPSA